jgi:hypothetical protein
MGPWWRVGRRSRPPRPSARRGQALLGALIAIGAVGLLVAGLYDIAIEGAQAGHASLAQLAAMSAAEGGLNVTLKILNDTANQTLIQNLGQVPRSTAQSWGQGSTSFNGAQQNFQAMMTGYGPLQWSAVFPYTSQAAPGTALVGANGVLSGPGGTNKWIAYAGLIAIPSPLPTWQDNGVIATLTFPIGFLGRAWVWGPPDGTPGAGQYLGEITSYSPPNIPGTIIFTYQDCPAYYQPAACNYPSAVQVTVPTGDLILNDPNAQTPAPP